MKQAGERDGNDREPDDKRRVRFDHRRAVERVAFKDLSGLVEIGGWVTVEIDGMELARSAEDNDGAAQQEQHKQNWGERLLPGAWGGIFRNCQTHFREAPGVFGVGRLSAERVLQALRLNFGWCAFPPASPLTHFPWLLDAGTYELHDVYGSGNGVGKGDGGKEFALVTLAVFDDSLAEFVAGLRNV